MRTNAMLTAAALLLSLAAPGATPQTVDPERKEQFQERLQKIKDRLELTPEQVEKVRPILIEEMQQMKGVRDKYSGEQSRRSRLRMARELRGIRDAADQQLKQILSKKQMDELKKIREENRERMKSRAGR